MNPRPWSSHLPAEPPFDVAALTARRSLPAAWAAVWGAQREAPLLRDGVGDGPSARAWVSAGQFDEQTRAVAAELGRRGLGPGDRMVWSMLSSVSAAAIVVGALRAGVVVIPANSQYTARELTHIVGDAKPKLAVVGDRGAADALVGANEALIVLGPDLRALGGPDMGRRASDAPVDVTLDGSAPEDAALIAYTSGTTGAPKGAVLSHANVLANSEAVALTWRWEPGDRLVHALPIFHGHGLCVALFGTLLAGSSAVLQPSFNPDSVLDAASAHQATMFFGVPTMYHRLAASPRLAELGRLRLCVSGSAPLPAALHHEIAARAATTVLERYGMTETLMTLSNPYEGDRRAGTVGFPFPGAEARLDGQEILVRGPTVFSGYLDRPAATAEAFTDGWFRTGDLAEVDDGYVRILGRSVELVISGGFNVYPAEVEDVLMAHPGVLEAAVTGTPSDEWGEVVTAWIVPVDSAGPALEAEVLAYAAQQLAPYKRPRLVRFVDALPRNAMGKVKRTELR